MIRAIVTDIEGTTSSLSFVKDILFPYARQHIGDYLRSHLETPAITFRAWIHRTGTGDWLIICWA